MLSQLNCSGRIVDSMIPTVSRQADFINKYFKNTTRFGRLIRSCKDCC